MNRKLLLLALLLCFAGGAFSSTLVQTSWRWRNNNGDEATATFRAGENIPITITDYSVIRLRIRVENEGTAEQHLISSLKYSTSNTSQGLFDDASIISDDNTNAFVYANGSGAPLDYAPTSEIASSLTKKNASFTFANGQYFSAVRSPLADAEKAPVPVGKYTDLEFVIKPTANVLPGTTYYFLIQNAKESSPPTLNHNVASLTTAAVLPVNFIAFDAKPEKNRIQLRWSTASERNNDRFEISRSADAKNWQYVASEKGKGNSDVASSYGLIDSKPLNGISYYQLTQFDFDGTKKVLSTQAVNLAIDPSVQVQVFPNPVSKEINVSVNNYLGKNIQAALYAQDGKLIHKEQLGGGTQKLALNTMPAAGVYVLKLVGSGLQVNKKIVIL